MLSSEYPLCRHLKTNGRRCQAPALTTSAFCRFHQKARRTRMTTISAGPGLSTRVVHSVPDFQSIQTAIGKIASGLAAGTIHPQKGHLLLQALYGVRKLSQKP